MTEAVEMVIDQDPTQQKLGLHHSAAEVQSGRHWYKWEYQMNAQWTWKRAGN